MRFIACAFVDSLRRTLKGNGWIERRSDRVMYEDHDPGDEHMDPLRRTTEFEPRYGPIRERWAARARLKT